MNTAVVAVAVSAVGTNIVAAEAYLVAVVGMHIAAAGAVVRTDCVAFAVLDCYSYH